MAQCQKGKIIYASVRIGAISIIGIPALTLSSCSAHSQKHDIIGIAGAFVRFSTETGLLGGEGATACLPLALFCSLDCQQLKRTYTCDAMVSLAPAVMECNEAAGSFPSRSMIQLVDQGQTSREATAGSSVALATFTAQRKLRKLRLSLQFAVDDAADGLRTISTPRC